MIPDQPEQRPMTAEEKKQDLYWRQKQLLDIFLEKNRALML